MATTNGSDSGRDTFVVRRHLDGHHGTAVLYLNRFSNWYSRTGMSLDQQPEGGAYMSLVDSVRAGLAELEPIDVRDRATADLAIKYAEGIDAPFDWADKQRDPLAELGPKLLACLTALGMTPAARKGIVVERPEVKPKGPLDELRARRAARKTP